VLLSASNTAAQHSCLLLSSRPAGACPDGVPRGLVVLQVLSQQQLRDNPAVRDSLRKALSSSGSSGSSPPMFFGIAVTDPDVAAFLGEATAQLPTALFWDSAPQLGASSRVDGYAPRAAGPLAQALAKYVGFSREAKAASVLTTLDVLWQRHTSGAWRGARGGARVVVRGSWRHTAALDSLLFAASSLLRVSCLPRPPDDHAPPRHTHSCSHVTQMTCCTSGWSCSTRCVVHTQRACVRVPRHASGHLAHYMCRAASPHTLGEGRQTPGVSTTHAPHPHTHARSTSHRCPWWQTPPRAQTCRASSA
jgi:hypothetical protein